MTTQNSDQASNDLTEAERCDGAELGARNCSPVTSRELWDLRAMVLNLGIGDPWDGEELENGYVRPIPEGFEEEVAKFDAMHARQIEDINAALKVIGEMAMRQSRLENNALSKPHEN